MVEKNLAENPKWVPTVHYLSAADVDISITNNTVTTEKKPNDKTNSITGTIILTWNNTFIVTGD